ncbi:alpha/beta fold hydrolase [Streptomyces sp. W16]|uniref:thioesterase II family protein n=1 Tax=Streptomyces sp. W16 TaxID=3076631 RepID=UPI00295ACD48|nr:alpha/beta fold hydrolase [Streptomyces sp. W16]MDV9171316.1 alpha/beta fold hydrolase [Streptomyces sp. W16]
MSETARWFPFVKPGPRPRLRLFCIPYAGGGATMYRTWPDALPGDIEVLAVQLPGRESRFSEPPYRRMEPLAEDLVRAMTPLLDVPYALVGYSMGAVIAHEVALRLRERGTGPEALFVCARRHPLMEPDFPVLEDTTGDEIWERLRDLGGMPKPVLDNPELRSVLLPQIRADLELNSSYRPGPERVHDCPVFAFGGRDDHTVTHEELSGWAATTRGSFGMRIFEGEHFFVRDHEDELVGEIARSPVLQD